MVVSGHYPTDPEFRWPAHFSRDNSGGSATPPALEAPSAAAGVCSGASRVGSLGFSAVSVLGKLAAGVSINPITGDSGADRLVPSELLDTQLRKS